MGGNNPGKKTILREMRHKQSAESLVNGLKLNLQGSILLYREETREFALYVPEDKYLQAVTALRHQFQVEFRGSKIHVWNGDEMEERFKIDLPDAFGTPVLDALNRKIIRFAAARPLGVGEDADEIIQRMTETLARQGSGI